MKNNNGNGFVGRLIRFLLIAVIAAVAVASYPQILKKAEVLNLQQANPDSSIIANQKEDFLKKLFQANYILSWDLLQQSNKDILLPSDMFLPKTLSSDESTALYAEDLIRRFNQVFDSWQNYFYEDIVKSYSLEYWVIDNKTGKTSTNSLQPLSELTDNPTQASWLKNTYAFYSAIQYQQDGTMKIPVWHGMEESEKNELLLMELNNTVFAEEDDAERQYIAQIVPPLDVTIIYAAKSEQYYVGQSSEASKLSKNFNEAGFHTLFWLSISCAMLLALFLPQRKNWYAKGGFATRIPLEIWILAALGTIVFYDAMLVWSNEIARGTFSIKDRLLSFLMIWSKDITPENLPITERTLSCIFIWLIWLPILYIWHLMVLSALQVINIGIKRYFRESTLLGKLFGWLGTSLRRNITSIETINLTDPYNKVLVRILVVHFVIIALICSIWLFGIILLIPYMLFVYYFIRMYLNKIKNNYAILLKATQQMAEKNLEISIDEDLGVFNPLKEELDKIQDGFKRAVDEEVKSQKMKSELITNVSHDLKTPVTAIITYVSLLQDEKTTEEEKHAYVEILNNKSQRLKQLIEDLFEFTRASSNNISLNLVAVDLVELIKQTQIELDDQIVESRVHFRFNLPEEKVIVQLDSEKTFRIFENLYTNIVKYSPPDSRAYIEMEDSDEEVRIIFKNVSSSELNFTPNEIMERFVRGDKSRHTEGSGLGLAIVRSLVELQGGSFRIELDGDLFKAVIQWKKTK